MPYIHSKLVSSLHHLSNEINAFVPQFESLESTRSNLNVERNEIEQFSEEAANRRWIEMQRLAHSERKSLADFRTFLEEAYKQASELDYKLSQRL